jgi:hypothetical protein
MEGGGREGGKEAGREAGRQAPICLLHKVRHTSNLRVDPCWGPSGLLPTRQAPGVYGSVD